MESEHNLKRRVYVSELSFVDNKVLKRCSTVLQNFEKLKPTLAIFFVMIFEICLTSGYCQIIELFSIFH